jgi:iron-sulfur cluster assembly protein
MSIQTAEQTPVATEPTKAPITVTEKAATKVKQIIADQQAGPDAPGKLYLRVRVVGGGCSGLQDKLDLDPQIDEKRDEVWDFFGVPVVVDRRSLPYLEGAVVDYHDELHRQGFSINNPNRKSTCGCGSSYTV